MVETKKLNGLDLFSGIGGISLALKPWVQTVAYCEIEPYAQAVLLERMQDGTLDSAPIWDDVTTLNREILDTEINIIFGGFPCQDISVAGKQLGIKSDTRSGLFHHIMRLVREFNPQYIFLENVAAICSNGLDTVLREITQTGYDARWCCLSAAEIGAPHKRDRWWLLAYPNKTGLQKERPEQQAAGPTRNSIEALADTIINHRWPSRPNEPQFEWEPPRVMANSKHAGRQSATPDGSLAETISNGPQGQNCPCELEGVCASRVSPSSYRIQTSGRNGAQSELGRNFDGLSYRTHRIKALGNSVVPQAARAAFERLMSKIV